MSWYVYIVQCNDGSLYTGVTTDVERRVEEHNSSTLGAKYTRCRRPVQVRYSEPQPTRQAACQREYAIKKMTRAKKLSLMPAEQQTSKEA